GTEDAGDRDTDEEEHLRGEPGVPTGDQTPDQPGGQEAVVEALVHTEGPGLLGELRGRARYTPANRAGPQEHLQHQDVRVDQRDQPYQDIADNDHRVRLLYRQRTMLDSARGHPDCAPAGGLPSLRARICRDSIAT